MAMIHISIADAARDFAGLIERVSEGAEFMIEDGARQLAVLRAPIPKGRTISESIALIRARNEKLGYTPVMDAEFAADMEEIIANRRPSGRSAWD